MNQCNGKDVKIYKPEESVEGVLVKPHCSCTSCDHWMNSADWCPTPFLKFQDDKGASARKEFLPKIFLRSEKNPGELCKIQLYKAEKLTTLQEKHSVFSKVLVHGERIPIPVNKINETYFSPETQASLENLKYEYSLPIQAFSWPAIFKNENILMIDGRKSGKTMSYLPAICTFSTRFAEKERIFSKHKGPFVVIVCPNSQQCEEILDLFNKFFPNVKTKPKICVMTYPITKMPNVDILLTIPDTLLECLKARLFTLKRLCYLILENVSNLLRKNEDSIYSILRLINEMLSHRTSNNVNVQMIATSEKWTSDLKNFLACFYKTPLVCISNYLEAALYGCVQLSVKFLTSELKLQFLLSLLKDDYNILRSIVFCNQAEVSMVNKWLVRNGINTIALSENCSKEEIAAYELEWIHTPGGHCKVLICTDFIFESYLTLKDAYCLIHFSLSESWTRFMKRFTAMSDNFSSPMDTTDEKVRCKSHILIDETCDLQMGKILNLISRISKDLPRKQQKFADSYKTKSENDKITKKMELCGKLKLFGKCGIPLCQKRHRLNAALDIYNDLPKSGKIDFKILKMVDVNLYTIYLIEHVDNNGTIWKLYSQDLQKPITYEDSENVQVAKNIKVGQFLVHCDYTTDGEVYNLCHVLKIGKNCIDVRLLTGVPLQTFPNKLLELPSNLKIIDIYLCNLIPPFKDESFSGRSYSVTKNALENKIYKSLTLTGTILLQVDGTLYLDNIVQQFNVGGTEVVKFNFTRFIMNLNVVESYQEQIRLLHKLCQKCDIELPNYIKELMEKPIMRRDVEPQEAFLDDNVQEVMFSSAVSPDEFYVRLYKFQTLLENLETELATAVQTTLLDRNVNIEIGKYCIIPDPKQHTYARAKIINVEDDKALCYYVDYGDETTIDIKLIKRLPNKFITKLPFQAIQCRLYGLCADFDKWDNAATEILYDFMWEPNGEIFRSLFVNVCATDVGAFNRVKTKYSVLLKDGYGDENILINRLVLDKGLAITISDGMLEDFYIPVKEKMEEEENDFDEGEELEESMDEDIKRITGDDCDLEIIDAEELLQLMGIKAVPQKEESQPKVQDVEDSIPQITELNEATSQSKNLTPEIYWSQNDQQIKIKIKLIGVENYTVDLVLSKIFNFRTTLNEKSYEVKFVLHKRAKIENHSAFGQQVVIMLKKLEMVEWQQLTETNKRLRFIHYEVPNEQKKVRRRFLQLDIPDSDSDRENLDEFLEYDSDLDSNSENELVSSDAEIL